MEIISNEKIKFNSLEENTFKSVMELGRKIIKDELKLIDNLIKKYRDKEIFQIKDSQKTVVKTKLGEIEFYRRRYEMTINGLKKYIYLLDEFLEIKIPRLWSILLITPIGLCYKQSLKAHSCSDACVS